MISWVRHVATRNAYTIMVGKLQKEKGQLGDLGTDGKKILKRYENKHWIRLTQYSVQWQVSVNHGVCKRLNLLTTYITIHCSGKTLHHRVSQSPN
jgi:hypothetical protein